MCMHVPPFINTFIYLFSDKKKVAMSNDEFVHISDVRLP